jgi:hypothetical protein
MPRFFLRTLAGDRLTEDPEGSGLPDFDAERAEAAAAACGIAAERLKGRMALGGERFENHDDAGRPLATVPFPEVSNLPWPGAKPPWPRPNATSGRGGARLATTVEKLRKAGHEWAAETAGTTLPSLKMSLGLARDRLRAVGFQTEAPPRSPDGEG